LSFVSDNLKQTILEKYDIIFDDGVGLSHFADYDNQRYNSFGEKVL
jgi:hypothetical protein